VLELVPAPLAAAITRSLTIPTIGIGAGPNCDGQVLVLHDMLGQRPLQREVRQALRRSRSAVRKAVGAFAAEVRQGTYPGKEHSFSS
jgi:3-methyl-2-oxobutanoate hydroxymethyltransferase